VYLKNKNVSATNQEQNFHQEKKKKKHKNMLQIEVGMCRIESLKHPFDKIL
jgi:hypothetical protein